MDSGATDNYAQRNAPVEQVKPISNPSPIHLTNGSTMTASHECILPNLPLISKESKTAQLCPDSNNTTLISVGKICDDDCTAVLSKRQCTIYKNKPFEPVLRAKRCPTTGMYVTRLSDPLLQNSFVSQQIKLANANLQ